MLADSQPDSLGDGFGFFVAAVALPRPEEAAQSVPVAARHDVSMQVWHALADDVIERDKRAVGSQRRGNYPREEPDVCEQRREQTVRHIGQRLDVDLWNEQAMPR